jgi:hypothetical protein
MSYQVYSPMAWLWHSNAYVSRAELMNHWLSCDLDHANWSFQFSNSAMGSLYVTCIYVHDELPDGVTPFISADHALVEEGRYAQRLGNTWEYKLAGDGLLHLAELAESYGYDNFDVFISQWPDIYFFNHNDENFMLVYTTGKSKNHTNIMSNLKERKQHDES